MRLLGQMLLFIILFVLIVCGVALVLLLGCSGERTQPRMAQPDYMIKIERYGKQDYDDLTITEKQMLYMAEKKRDANLNPN